MSHLNVKGHLWSLRGLTKIRKVVKVGYKYTTMCKKKGIVHFNPTTEFMSTTNIVTIKPQKIIGVRDIRLFEVNSLY